MSSTARIRIHVGILLGVMLASRASMAQDAPLFPDKALEAIVREYVFEKRNTDMPLVEADVQNISTIQGKFREGEGEQVKDLTGLEKCRSLALLDLGGHAIEDVSPLKDLTNLQSVDLSHNRIQKIEPLAGLTGLQYLQLEGNQIGNVEPLRKLEALRSLYLSGNQIKDLGPLEGLTKLWSLYLAKNQIADLKPLAPLTRIESLDLQENEIVNLEPLAGYTDLKYLMLENNKITDVGVLVEMAKRDYEGEKRFAPFWSVYLSGNPLSEQARQVQLPELKKFGCRLTFE